MGAAVFDAEERPQWALSLTGIEQRFPEARRRELGALLLREAHELTQVLRGGGRQGGRQGGHRGPAVRPAARRADQTRA